MIYNLTRYNTSDLQSFVDEMKSGIETAGGQMWDPPQGAIVFRELNVVEARSYPAGQRGFPRRRASRNFVQSTSWANPHHIRLMTPDKLMSSQLEVFASTPREDGWYEAPREMREHLILHLMDHLGRGLSNVDWDDLRDQGGRMLLRYKLGKKPKAPVEVRELEKDWAIQKRWNRLTSCCHSGTWYAASAIDRLKHVQELLVKNNREPIPQAKLDEMVETLSEAADLMSALASSKGVMR
jgi:hypothetical protein